METIETFAWILSSILGLGFVGMIIALAKKPKHLLNNQRRKSRSLE
ncbi:hypothetical protein AB1K84_11930 [Mesobacillus foraminis]|jgi:hypothetical protein|uniref:Uncharacterized protein n=1 Tax=Mesobacillus foraminis TaxID=279826 RepID=A0A4R2BJH3_9BACI|nr:hypothetical protein [Mesobacillus foraminis]MBT2758514.1 hypothetical protein [Mesobacillus foraminis]TCN26765.1 hypothetical protein EV146_103288 [Mesobacillus foraminis]